MAEISKGAVGESLAARFLREKDYDIVSSNVRSRFGEVDIIATKGPYIAFVEVKTRFTDALYAPAEAVGKSKQQRVSRTAALFLQQHADIFRKLQPRFDVIEVYIDKDSPMEAKELNHIMGAYEMEGLHEAF